MKIVNKLVLIAGGTASGKTSIAKGYVEQFEKGHKSTSLLEMDDYYFPKKELIEKFQKEGKDIDWDNPNTVNWELLVSDVKKLLSGENITKLKYDFATESYGKHYEIKAADVIVVEGIFALINQELMDLAVIKVYIQADSDIRLIRRIQRDMHIRSINFDINAFLERWTTKIKPAHNKFIEPSKQYADFIINTNKVEIKKASEELGNFLSYLK